MKLITPFTRLSIRLGNALMWICRLLVAGKARTKCEPLSGTSEWYSWPWKGVVFGIFAAGKLLKPSCREIFQGYDMLRWAAMDRYKHILLGAQPAHLTPKGITFFLYRIRK